LLFEDVHSSDSDTPPNLVALTGYFGPSKKADSIRLYPSLDFQSYFEIPKAAIIATTPVDAEDDQSPTVVHVKAGTSVEAVQTSTQPVESYLQGGITGAYYRLYNPQPSPWALLYTLVNKAMYTFCACRPQRPQAAAQAAVLAGNTLLRPCVPNTFDFHTCFDI